MIFRRTNGELLFIGPARRSNRSEALACLRLMAEDARGMQALRAALAGVRSPAVVASLDDLQVLGALATQVTRGRLALVQLRPREGPAPPPLVQASREPPPPEPAPAPPRRITDLRWSEPRVEIGQEVDAIFSYEGLDPGERVTVTVCEQDQGAASAEVSRIDTQVEASGGEHRVRWRREPAAAEADLREDERAGDMAPLEYRFAVEAEGASCEGLSGPLWLTQTVVVRLRKADGEGRGRDGVEVLLRAADGTRRAARTARGEARFERVVVGPLRFEIKARVRRALL